MYAQIDETGRVIAAFELFDVEPPEGENIVELPYGVSAIAALQLRYTTLDGFVEDLGLSPNSQSLEECSSDLMRALFYKQQERIDSVIQYGGTPFDADPISRSRISGLLSRIQRGDGLTAGWMGWRDAINNMHWATDDAATVATHLAALSSAIENREQALLIAAWTHKHNISQLTTVESILAYDVNSGWPE